MAANQQLVTAKKDLTNTIQSEEYQQRIASMMPPDIDRKRFTAVVLRALQENPDLLTADKSSLLLACQRAAQDGLVPDKREGAMVMYGKQVQWQPMIGGLRKLIAKHGFDIRADVVYEQDHFDYDMGDNPSITHKPPQFGTARGKIIGAYAIATDEQGRKYREVMDLVELEKVRAVSKNKGTGPWAQWTAEMYRKTVAKRLMKQLPLSDDRLQDVIARDNEQFEMGPVGPTPVARAVQDAARQQAASRPQSAGPDAIEGDFDPVEPEGDGDGEQVEDPLL